LKILKDNIFMKLIYLLFFILFSFIFNTSIVIADVSCEPFLYGVYPGGFSGAEDDFSDLDIESYMRHTKSTPQFIYFSHNWYKSHEFPPKMVDMIYKKNMFPWIRLMLRSGENMADREKKYTLDNINNGLFDEDFIKWFNKAKSYRRLMYVEYGIEVNGEWFPWSGKFNGKHLGPQKFRQAYRRIINLSRQVGADNIKWSFHLDTNEAPKVEWNKFENYYPGDNLIDIITISNYAMLTPADVQVKIFHEKIDLVYWRIVQMAPTKKIVIIEFGTTRDNKLLNQENWANVALDVIFSKQYRNIIGFSWWNEAWFNKNGIAPTTMRVQDNSKLSKVFERQLKKLQNVCIN